MRPIASLNRGVVLVSVLLVCAILLMLGGSLLWLVRQDRLAVRHEAWQRQAYYAARAGLLWYQLRGLPPVSAETNSRRVVVQAQGPEIVADVEERNRWLRSTGLVLGPHRTVLARRVVMVPLWDLSRVMEVSPP